MPSAFSWVSRLACSSSPLRKSGESPCVRGHHGVRPAAHTGDPRCRALGLGAKRHRQANQICLAHSWATQQNQHCCRPTPETIVAARLTAAAPGFAAALTGPFLPCVVHPSGRPFDYSAHHAKNPKRYISHYHMCLASAARPAGHRLGRAPPSGPKPQYSCSSITTTRRPQGTVQSPEVPLAPPDTAGEVARERASMSSCDTVKYLLLPATAPNQTGRGSPFGTQCAGPWGSRGYPAAPGEGWG
eukprot:scaffold47053_cov77-Phaeocystis_antarctica.AAC.1